MIILEKLAKEVDRLQRGIQAAANECDCRAEHGAAGKEHLIAVKKMLQKLIEE